MQHAFGDDLRALDVHFETLRLEFTEAPRFVARERARRVESTSVEPHAPRAHRPRLLDGAREHHAAESTSDELRNQTEVVDLDRSAIVAIELEVARRLVAHEQLPDADVGCREMLRELVVGPVQPLMPVPRLADLAVQTTVYRNGAGRASLDPGARVGGGCRAELGRVVEREIRSDDLDAAQG